MEAPPRFQVGRLYERGELHAEYRGQRQRGIITPADHPVIFIISGSTGLLYGYADTWDEDGVFHYFGEGQTGNMRFEAGNAAIRDHAVDEKELHLFEHVKGKDLRYRGEMVCSGYEWKTAPDKTGASRQAIVFQLIPAAAVPTLELEDTWGSGDLTELARAADEDPTEHSDSHLSLQRAFARSRALRRYVRARAKGVCEGCEQPAPFSAKDGSGYLEAHHTRRRSDSGPGNRRTVIALCPNCHSRIHFGKDGDSYNHELQSKLRKIET
jgi:5-methylcytosine-specific restriction protein A